MAIAIISDNDIRKIRSTIHGYGEVPMVRHDGKIGWALPGERITYDEDVALAYAQQLDKIISKHKERLKNRLS